VGTANFDYRSLRLNFEVTCLIESLAVANDLAMQFRRDFAVSIRVDPKQFELRPAVGKLAENGARLMSPLL
jgi:cardiolipin synthase